MSEAPQTRATRETREALGTRDVATSRRFDDVFLRKLEALSLVARRAVLGQARGERRSRRVGSGIELADFRDYVAGDDLRFVDWSLYARLDRPMVRLREEREDLTLAVLVDGSGSMGVGHPPKLELAARLGGALAYVGFSNHDRVSVAVATTSGQRVLPPARGRAGALRALELFDTATAGGRTDLGASLRDVLAASGARRRGLVVIISDFFDPAGWRPALDRVRFARWDAIAVQISSAEDALPAPDDDAPGEVLIEDAETGDARRLWVTPAFRRAYGERYTALKRGLAAACRERQIPLFDVPANAAFDQVVLQLFRSGQVLR